MIRPASGRALGAENGGVKDDGVAAKAVGKNAAGTQQRRFGTNLSNNANNNNNNIGLAPASKQQPAKPVLAAQLPSNADSKASAPAPAPVVDNVSASDVAGALDIDYADRYNEMAVTEYVEEIYTNLRRKETELMPPANYMSIQDDVNEKMRAILIDWLIEVHLKFKLRHETLFLTVNILDRFLAVQKVNRQRLQLVGVVALMIAAKYEEIYPPEVRDYVYICDNAYTREQIIQMEQLMLSKLNFRLTVPTPRSFLKRYCKAAQGDSKLLLLVSYLLELALVDYSFLGYKPSILCAAATSVALQVTGRPSWSPTLAKYSRYVESDLKECIADMNALHAKSGTGSQKAAHKKYSSPRFHSVASLAPITPTN